MTGSAAQKPATPRGSCASTPPMTGVDAQEQGAGEHEQRPPLLLLLLLLLLLACAPCATQKGWSDRPKCTVLVSVNASMEPYPPSRPRPEAL